MSADHVTLVPVDEDVLERLVAAATTDASPDDVTPPQGDGAGWTPGRVAWLQAFHRGARHGLSGPGGEATWAVVTGGDVVGSVRLARTPEPGVLETGLWLTRAARGRGTGRAAVDAVVRQAAALGATAVRARTTTGNAPARAVLAGLGFALTDDPDGVAVHAVLQLGGSPPGA